MAYSARFTGNTTVLSTRYAGTSDGIISGLLYVPDLPSGDSCIYETASHVPMATVHQANLPPMNYHLIAIAPWVNDRCANAYLTAARAAPVRAFLFYMPGTDAAPPLPADSPAWYIEDRADWMTQTSYPVYAVSGMAGEVMMQHLSLYSGNMTEVPFGHNITERFQSDPGDYLRIWTELDISTQTAAFATWVYALIIIGVLFAVITSTSFLMHVVQARGRLSLRRRVVAGEVNLEAMGIKHLTVPMEHIQRFPLFTYHYEPDTNSPPVSPRSAQTTRTRARTLSLDQTERVTAGRSATVSDLAATSPFAASTTATDYQPNCEICLEPYENRVTVIRELSCGHIFHPECIDEFLHEISSLCPICKASMLPEGYCPKVTNAMVRRERAMRRLRGRIHDMPDVDDEETGSRKLHGWWTATKSRILGSPSGLMSSTSTELQEVHPRPPRIRPPQEVRLQPRSHRLEDSDPQAGAPTALARERMRELAGFQPDYGEGGSTRCKSYSDNSQSVRC
jgi:hypothetical protein